MKKMLKLEEIESQAALALPDRNLMNAGALDGLRGLTQGVGALLRMTNDTLCSDSLSHGHAIDFTNPQNGTGARSALCIQLTNLGGTN
jgi:hypothetical protein